MTTQPTRQRNATHRYYVLSGLLCLILGTCVQYTPSRAQSTLCEPGAPATSTAECIPDSKQTDRPNAVETEIAPAPVSSSEQILQSHSAPIKDNSIIESVPLPARIHPPKGWQLPNLDTKQRRIRWVSVFGTLKFREPTQARKIPGTDFWHIIERSGTMYTVAHPGRVDIDDEEWAPPHSVALDLTQKVESRPYEAGFLSFAYSPKFLEDRFIYLSYTAREMRVGHEGTKEMGLVSYISRWTVQPDLTIDPTSEAVIIRLPQPGPVHNGGHIEFDNDGFLFIGFGDGANANTVCPPCNYAERMDKLHGKLLRIDVSKTFPYSIPPDNPFIGKGPYGEIYAMGLRNPWRFSIDANSNDIWVGDVGLSNEEEVLRIEGGAHYGWAVWGGTQCIGRSRCNGKIYQPPIAVYPHQGYSAIVMGPVYRGSLFPELVGKVLFSDLMDGDIRTLGTVQEDGLRTVEVLQKTTLMPSSFTTDEEGEAYMIHYRSKSGGLYKLIPGGKDTETTVPQRLSEMNLMEPDRPSQPKPWFIPYTLNQPFWSDHAEKERWFYVPKGKAARATWSGDLAFPVGSILLKQFRRAGRLLETRVMIHQRRNQWRGLSFAWNEDETDAELVHGRMTREQDGFEPWVYPSESNCFACHTEAAGTSLGPEVWQFDRVINSDTDRAFNQLSHFQSLGVIKMKHRKKKRTQKRNPKHAEARWARNYLHVNCSGCHRPKAPYAKGMDLRRTTTLHRTGICNVATSQRVWFRKPEHFRLIPGSAERSELLKLMGSRDHRGMPPIGTRMADVESTTRLGKWIDSLKSCRLIMRP